MNKNTQLCNSKLFLYRYEFDPITLEQFVADRYQRDPELLEIALTQRITVNGRKTHPQRILEKGDVIEYLHLRSDETEKVPPLSVLYEDEDLFVISKPDFLPVTPSGRFYFNSIAVHVKELTNNPMISPLHRLDIETSGVLAFGKHKEALSRFQPLFAKKVMDKTYLALVFGQPEIQEITGDLREDPANSAIHTKQHLFASADPKAPKSHSEIVEVTPYHNPEGEKYSLVKIKPITGKTNQLRAHLSGLGFPIVGDKKYYYDEDVYLDWYDHRDINRIVDRIKLQRQALHCTTLRFIHPVTKQEFLFEDTTHPEKLWFSQLNLLP